MLCDICLGVLQGGRNPAKLDRSTRSYTLIEKNNDQASYNVETPLMEDVADSIEQEAQYDLATNSSEGITDGSRNNVTRPCGADNSDITDQDCNSLLSDGDSGSNSDKAKTACMLRHWTSLNRTDEFYGHHRTLLSLQISVESRCQICSRAWDRFSEERQPTLGDADKSSDSFLIWAQVASNSRSSNPFLEFRLLHQDSLLGHFTLYPNSDDWTESPAVTSDCTASPESLSKAEEWLQQCNDSHDQCHQESRATPWYPTRLLDLGEVDQNANNIRLIHTRDYTVNGPYLTLSHRWGGADFLRLTDRNIDRLCSSFPILELPRTFQEAVTVTKALKVRYLWIDSLCIRQDRLSDWAAEAGQMDRVYSNSYCNISATDASDSSDGLFRHREPQVIQDTVVRLCPNTCKFRNAHPAYILLEDTLIVRELGDTDLHKRGWVLQERVLAPRVLHFCREQLFWECRSRLFCEQHPRDIPETYMRSIWKPFLKANHAYSADKVDWWYDFWSEIIEQYSRTSLTRLSDKLVALSGIAKMVRFKTDDVYIAGMWFKTLPHQLMWQRVGGTGTRAALYRAPSWSWACVEGVITWPDVPADQAFSITVENVHLDYTTNDDTGQIRGGWIDLQGFLRPVSLQWVGQEFLPFEHVWRLALSTAHPDHDPWHMQGVAMDDTSVRKETIFQRSAAKEYFSMPWFQPYSDPVTYYRHFCLLLRLVDAEEALYERVGVSPYCRNDFVRSMFDESDKSLESIPCLRYGNGKHTVRII